MGADPGGHGASTLRDYLRVLRRRKWLVLQAIVIVPAVAVALSLRQEKLYEASAEVLLSRQNLAASLTGTPDLTLSQDAARLVETQASLARVPAVAERALRSANVTDRTAQEFLDSSSVSGKANADLLQFTVTDSDPALAARLASEYAKEFTIYRRELDTAAVLRARRGLTRRLQVLEGSGGQDSALYASLAEKEEQLRTVEALQTANSFVVRSPAGAKQVQPRPVRNGILGLGLGLMLGLGLAFLREALDTRVRSAEEISERLGLPLLARLPQPPKRLRSRNGLVMLDDPAGVHAEAFRMLRTNLEFMSLDRRVRTIMVTSAVEKEGKSTTIANLAVAAARAGKRVVLVDLDLRRPYLRRLFALDERRSGLTDVALGRAELADAIVPIALTEGAAESAPTNGHRPVQGVLEVVCSGQAPPDPGEFVGRTQVTEILDRLADRADLVLVDAPPLLHVGDAMVLSAQVDALFLVTRMDIVRRPMLTELQRVLTNCPAEKLGFALTDAKLEETYGYGAGSYSYHGYAEKEKIKERVK